MPVSSFHRDLSERLSRDGYALVEDFLTLSDVDTLLDAFHSLDCAAHHGAWNVSLNSSDVAYRRAVDRAVKEVMTPRAASMFPGYRICFGNFLIKEPHQGGGGVVPIHQDPAFVDESLHDTFGLWIPLVDISRENGAIAVLPGSHCWNRGPRAIGGMPPPDVQRIAVEQAMTLTMRAGTALVFSQKLFHGSPANRGTATRIAAGVLLAPTHAQLRCYYANPSLPDKVEVFEVDDAFYTSYIYGRRPEGVARIAVIDQWHDAIDPAQVTASPHQATTQTR